jgi:hypothetical protein
MNGFPNAAYAVWIRKMRRVFAAIGRIFTPDPATFDALAMRGINPALVPVDLSRSLRQSNSSDVNWRTSTAAHDPTWPYSIILLFIAATSVIVTGPRPVAAQCCGMGSPCCTPGPPCGCPSGGCGFGCSTGCGCGWPGPSFSLFGCRPCCQPCRPVCGSCCDPSYGIACRAPLCGSSCGSCCGPSYPIACGPCYGSACGPPCCGSCGPACGCPGSVVPGSPGCCPPQTFESPSGFQPATTNKGGAPTIADPIESIPGAIPSPVNKPPAAPPNDKGTRFDRQPQGALESAENHKITQSDVSEMPDERRLVRQSVSAGFHTRVSIAASNRLLAGTDSLPLTSRSPQDDGARND